MRLCVTVQRNLHSPSVLANVRVVMHPNMRLFNHQDCEYKPVLIERGGKSKTRGWVDLTHGRYQWGTAIRPDGTFGSLQQFTFDNCLSLGADEWRAIAMEVSLLDFVDNEHSHILRTELTTAATVGNFAATKTGYRFLVPLIAWDTLDWFERMVTLRKYLPTPSLFGED